jgi:hypothetical protein
MTTTERLAMLSAGMCGLFIHWHMIAAATCMAGGFFVLLKRGAR